MKYENFTSISISECINRTDSLEKLIKPHIKQGQTNVLLLSIEKSKPNGISHLDAMLVSQKLNIACVNGYSAIEPKDYGVLKDTVNLEALEPWKTKYPDDFKKVNLIYIK